MDKPITAEDVKLFKDRSGWTLKKISDEVGVTKEQVWKWTKGLAEPNNSSQILLAKIIKD